VVNRNLRTADELRSNSGHGTTTNRRREADRTYNSYGRKSCRLRRMAALRASAAPR